MKTPLTTFNDPITFYHMHAGCVKPFGMALDDATELQCDCLTKVYGYVIDMEGFTHRLNDGRRVAASSTEGESVPYWTWVCLIENDLQTLTLVHPVDTYWDKVEYYYRPGGYHPSRTHYPGEKNEI